MTAVPMASPIGGDKAGVVAASADGHAFVRALDGRIKPVRVGVGYHAGAFLAAVTMLLLPLVYLALVAAAAYGVYWYAVNGVAIFEGGGNVKGKLVIYLVPLLVGGILVLFLVKPIFARRARGTRPLELGRSDEPLLFAFVDRLCDVVGAPKPSRIAVDTRVNASAGFREGIVGFLRKDLVLTIGLPLAAGLTMRQFAGVLAHEFGHFAQGTGMRLTFVVRTINAWFARVVYERDSWDEWLAGSADGGGHWGAAIVVGLARACVWVTRRVLWLLMMIGHGVSSFMLRQMEYDADRYETRVAGSDAFAETCERVRSLSVASNAAFDDLRTAWQERRLGDDLSLLVLHRDTSMPPAVRDAIRRAGGSAKTGWFDTHPCDASRVASSRRDGSAGLFHVDEPATELFADFCLLSRNATIAFYRDELGLNLRAENLVSSSDLIGSQETQEEKHGSVGRYFQGLVHPVRPLFVPAGVDGDGVDPDAAAEQILSRRGELVEAAAGLRPVAAAFLEADHSFVKIVAVRSLLSAGAKVDFAAVGVPKGTYDTLRAEEQRAAARRDAAATRLRDALAPQFERLRLALLLDRPGASATRPASGAATPAGHNTAGAAADDDAGAYDLAGGLAGGGGAYDVADESTGESDPHLAALAALGRAAGPVGEVRAQLASLGALLRQLKPDNNSETLVNELIARSRKLVRGLDDARQALHGVAYPYSHVERGFVLSRFVVAAVPPPEQVGAVYEAADAAVDAYYPLYLRVLGDLCSRAEAAEESIGLSPLPAPPQGETPADDAPATNGAAAAATAAPSARASSTAR